jgi:hypothetical protein
MHRPADKFLIPAKKSQKLKIVKQSESHVQTALTYLRGCTFMSDGNGLLSELSKRWCVLNHHWHRQLCLGTAGAEL